MLGFGKKTIPKMKDILKIREVGYDPAVLKHYIDQINVRMSSFDLIEARSEKNAFGLKLVINMTGYANDAVKERLMDMYENEGQWYQVTIFNEHDFKYPDAVNGTTPEEKWRIIFYQYNQSGIAI